MPKRKDIHLHFSVTAVSSGTSCYLYIYRKSAYVIFLHVKCVKYFFRNEAENFVIVHSCPHLCMLIRLSFF